MGGSRRTSESSSCCHLLRNPSRVGECAFFGGQAFSDSRMPEPVALLLIQTWVVRGERENSVVGVAIAQWNING